MNVEEIINDVDGNWMPNSFPLASKVMWLNNIQNEIYRYVELPYTKFETDISGTTYPLPIDCLVDGIKFVSIVQENGTEIEYPYIRQLSKFKPNRYYTIDDRNIVIFPEPTLTDKAFRLYYVKRPTPLTVDNLVVEPDLPADFHSVYVLGLTERVARALNRYEEAQVYKNEFQEQLMNMNRTFSNEPDGGFGVKLSW